MTIVPMNAWGAYNLGILSGLGVEEPLKVFLQAVLLNFYAFAAVLLALAVILWKIDIGPMIKDLTKHVENGGDIDTFTTFIKELIESEKKSLQSKTIPLIRKEAQKRMIEDEKNLEPSAREKFYKITAQAQKVGSGFVEQKHQLSS